LSTPAYSIVIPAYNESERIGSTLERVRNYVSQQNWDAEIIVVNDGSRDQTRAIAEAHAAQDPRLRIVDNPGNHGKGYSVRHGMLEARGAMRIFSDADMSSPIEEADKLFDALAAGADIAIGSRWLNSELQTRRQSWQRQLMGRAFNLVPRVVLGLNYKDTQCGFKAFTRHASDVVFGQQLIDGWGFDPELLFIARKSGLKIAEVAVTWAHSDGTRISPLRDGTRMVMEMFKIRWNGMAGKYTYG
jgi:glycosyltransferase involved in cell wall biosynthesis